MMQLLTSAAVFTAAYLLFVLAVRVHRQFHTVKAQLIFFAVGFGFDVIAVHQAGFLHPADFSLPVTSVLFYILLSVAAVIVSASPLMGEASPSTLIYLYIGKRYPARISELKTIVAPSLHIRKRLAAMEETGWIRRRDNRWYCLRRGIAVSRAVRLVRKILSLKETG